MPKFLEKVGVNLFRAPRGTEALALLVQSFEWKILENLVVPLFNSITSVQPDDIH